MTLDLNNIPTGMSLTVELVTPQLAQEILDRCNTASNQRRLHSPTVSTYARVIRAGQWEQVPGQVAFATDGTLINGQHTLHAIVEAGVAQHLAITTGCSPGAIRGFDSGLKRSVGQVLRMTGTSAYSTQLAATIRMAARYGLRHGIGRRFSGHLLPSFRILPTEACQIVEDNPDVVRAVERAYGLYNQNPGCGGATTTSTLLALVDHPLVDEFVEKVTLGYNLSPGDAALATRNALLNRARAGSQSHPDERLAVIIKGWQRWVQGKTCAMTLKYGQDEVFPLLNAPRLLVMPGSKSPAVGELLSES